MWQEKILVLGRSCRGHVICANGHLGSTNRSDHAQRQIIRSPFHPEPSHPVEMEARINHDLAENNMYEDALHDLFRYRAISTMFAT